MMRALLPRIRLSGFVLAVLVAMLPALTPSSANAITYGVPDGGAHPNVGSFVGVWTDSETGETSLFQLCTGTLIDVDVVLSASHCFSGLPPEITAIYFTLDEVIDADLDGEVDATVNLLTGEAVTHPLFASGGQNNTYDIAVYLLDDAVTGVEPAPIATADFLSTLSSPRQQTFTAVGYGTVRQTNRQGPQAFSPGWRREQADQHLLSLTTAWVTFSMNLATGNGGTCYGDSGGPHFLGDTVVAITVTGDRYCKATDKAYRIDTPWAQEFLARFVTIP